MTKMSEQAQGERLLRRYLDGGSTEERREYMGLLIKKYGAEVRTIARREKAKLPPFIELDDLVSYAMTGFMDAVEDFDPKVGKNFGSYFPDRVRGAIKDELRRIDRVPRVVRKRQSQLKKATSFLEKISGRRPRKVEILLELAKGKYRDGGLESYAKETCQEVDPMHKAEKIFDDGNSVGWVFSLEQDPWSWMDSIASDKSYNQIQAKDLQEE